MKLISLLIMVLFISCNTNKATGIRRGYIAIDTTYVIDGTIIETTRYIKK